MQISKLSNLIKIIDFIMTLKYCVASERFCYAAYNSPKFNGFINCTF
jgi:hypothetical protein